ncbi:MAG TPA: response regulator transcription factor [Microlunatus sp.]
MRVLVADDMMLLRRGVVAILAGAGLEVVGEVPDAVALLRAVDEAHPDVAVVDIRMPPTHTTEGLEAALVIRSEHPAVSVLLLSQYLESSYAMRLLQDQPGSVGYLIKDRVLDPEVLLDAIRRVHDGQTVIDPTIVARLLARPRRDAPLARLTAREHEVLALLAEGLSNRAIAARIFVTDRTVEAHIRSVFDKLDLTDSPEHHRRVLAVLAHLRA